MKTVATLLVTLLALTSPAVKPRRHLFVFEDITMSLASDQADAVQNIVAGIIEKVPAGTEVTVVPICENTEGAPQISQTLPFPKGTSKLAQGQALASRKAFEQAISNAIRDIHNQTRATKTNYASCISPALRVVNSSLHGADGSNTDVIFVSDMIEECRVSLLGQPVRLKLADRQFAEAMRLAGKNEALVTLSGARIFVMFPRAISTTQLLANNPAPADLQSFWQHIFARSGITADRLWWAATVPQYIESLHG